MRISQLAKLADTSVRAIRYYHQRGLLPAPAEGRDGVRDYSVRDGLRVLQIRFLVDAGLPTDGLSGTADDPGAEVADLLEAVAQQRARLDSMRGSLGRLDDTLRRTGTVSFLPAEIASLLDRVAVVTPAELAEPLAEERAACEILAAHGRLPDVLTAWASEAEPDRVAALYRRLATLRLAGYPDADTADLARAFVAEVPVRTVLSDLGIAPQDLAAHAPGSGGDARLLRVLAEVLSEEPA